MQCLCKLMLFKYLKCREMFLTGQWEENNVLHFLFYFPEPIIWERSQSYRNNVCSQAVPDGSIHSHVFPPISGGSLPPMKFPMSAKLPGESAFPCKRFIAVSWENSLMSQPLGLRNAHFSHAGVVHGQRGDSRTRSRRLSGTGRLTACDGDGASLSQGGVSYRTYTCIEEGLINPKFNYSFSL